MQDHQDLRNGFNWAGRGKQPACKTFRVLTKNEKTLKIFQKILRFSDQNLYGNGLFSHFLLNISWISASSLKECTSGRWHQISTTIFPISGEGDVPASPPPPDATEIGKKSQLDL